ncbi:MAG: hypothetical protein KIT18_15880, partial [Burkholderiales bacterium]|nr:hypothetical protein [Burkholderiales bacterium]
MAAAPSPAQQITLALDDLEAPGFSAKTLEARLDAGKGELRLNIGTLAVQGQLWRDVRVHCPKLHLERYLIACTDAVVDAGSSIPVSFSYSVQNRVLEATVRPGGGESWRLDARFGGVDATFSVTVSNGGLARLAPWLPPEIPRPTGGTVNGTITQGGSEGIAARLAVQDLAFGDTAGLRAGEKVAADVDLRATRRDGRWTWQGRLMWKGGEVFWQPLFAAGTGQVLEAAGTADERRITADRGKLALPAIGEFEFSAAYDLTAGQLATANARAADIDVSALYERLLKPALQGTVLGDLRGDGRADVALELRNGAVHAADLVLRQVSFEDRARRFALFGVNGTLPWHRDQLTAARLTLVGGEVLRVPFGTVDLPLELRGIRVRTKRIVVPVLDGRVTISDFAT